MVATSSASSCGSGAPAGGGDGPRASRGWTGAGEAASAERARRRMAAVAPVAADPPQAAGAPGQHACSTPLRTSAPAPPGRASRTMPALPQAVEPALAGQRRRPAPRRGRARRPPPRSARPPARAAMRSCRGSSSAAGSSREAADDRRPRRRRTRPDPPDAGARARRPPRAGPACTARPASGGPARPRRHGAAAQGHDRVDGVGHQPGRGGRRQRARGRATPSWLAARTTASRGKASLSVSFRYW